ncbi:hypothetical protein A8F94_05655 [Bacillus sp. FJAT-27225]|uniref:YsnF/AvaK domain-containing protein n=1 Tax=Bacillus sp. FJAT-27225 TaxID=1743144 RepID=UPI00080C25A7|nr:YsnF/AvaK domain-containing protein [Bacillus sp. FJAT-27225]OCA91345.1 hypothetical protein A8F94_05655 [Bacillus sp. FJAT-27225]
MRKRVVGVYNTQEELIEAVERYQKDGNSLTNLSVFGNTEDSMSRLGNLTGMSEAQIYHGDTKEDKGFLDKMVSKLDGLSQDMDNSYYDRLVGAGVSETEAREYAGDLESGRLILFEEIHGGKAVDAGAASTGLFNDTPVQSGTNIASTTTSDTLESDEERTLRLREEQLKVDKDRVQTGEVEIHKDVVEEQKTIDVPVTHEEVYVERRPADGNEANLDAGPIGENETIRVPIVEEKVEVTKKPVVNEELVIGKKEVESSERVVENVKREEAHIESEGETDIRERRKDRF